MISEIFAGAVFASSAKVATPASVRVCAIFGPIPSIFLRSAPLVEAFLAGAFSVTAGVASFLGATAFAFGSAFLVSFFGAAFLAPEATMLSITISESD